MYFLVNAAPPKPLDIATSNFAKSSFLSNYAKNDLKKDYLTIFLHNIILN